jgi:hypothetical protein
MHKFLKFLAKGRKESTKIVSSKWKIFPKLIQKPYKSKSQKD